MGGSKTSKKNCIFLGEIALLSWLEKNYWVSDRQKPEIESFSFWLCTVEAGKIRFLTAPKQMRFRPVPKPEQESTQCGGLPQANPQFLPPTRLPSLRTPNPIQLVTNSVCVHSLWRFIHRKPRNCTRPQETTTSQIFPKTVTTQQSMPNQPDDKTLAQHFCTDILLTHSFFALCQSIGSFSPFLNTRGL